MSQPERRACDVPIRHFEGFASRPGFGWMAVAFPGRTYAEAVEMGDRLIREEFPGWVFTLTGDSTPCPHSDEGEPSP